VGHAPAIFDQAKLDWLNAHYLREADPKWLADLLLPFFEQAEIPPGAIEAKAGAWSGSGKEGTFGEAVIRTFRERAKTLRELAQNSRFLFRVRIDYDPQAVEKQLRPQALTHLRELYGRLQQVSPFDAATLEGLYRDFAAERGLKLGDVAQPTRVAVTGGSVSPPLFLVMELAGREICLERLATVLERGAA